LPTPSRSFLCLRHGVTDWNAQGRFQGRTDIPLNDEGISQADAAALRLRNVRIDHVVASPLVRAARTAEIVAASLAAPLAIDDRLIECDFGNLEGISIAKTMKWPHGPRATRHDPARRWRGLAFSLGTHAPLRRPMARQSSASKCPVRLPRRGDAGDVGSAVRPLVRQPPRHAFQV
jgi:broad specificity phosphatase PhoE